MLRDTKVIKRIVWHEAEKAVRMCCGEIPHPQG